MVFEDIEVVIKKLYKYCLRLSGSPWTAEDLVQETILKVYKIKKTEPKREFTFSYLCTVAKNQFIDETRKYKESILFNEDLFGEACDFIDYDSLIEILLTTLPLKQAMLVTLKDVFGYTSKEMASMLRISNEAIKTALHRSRKKLKLQNNNKDMEIPFSNQEMIIALTKAIREVKPMQIFYLYRLLESQNFKVRRSSIHSLFYVIDPDGNILEITS
ncbi:RNA polymerase subunit sigma-24 [Niallia circulans]|uniref:RNA polymerase sigma factor n=1 Tax=Niallia circulans TaxID=1397 RepID=A0A0J1INY7_NIACI|nr:RNA polymerase sigma factor [Niallia circulans]KLV27676.1 RNA polymerase subunit sigma-24 [Niallia circulans]MED5101779.1 RNA polymerase sigma factor [Niallia circulans]